MWSHAVYALRVKPKLFWKLTPKQYTLLCDRHRDELVHREMVAAFTTAAIVNFSLSAPEKPVAPLEWMPNYKAPQIAAPSSHSKADRTAFDCRRAQLTAELKTYAETGIAGPVLLEMGYADKA